MQYSHLAPRHASQSYLDQRFRPRTTTTNTTQFPLLPHTDLLQRTPAAPKAINISFTQRSATSGHVGSSGNPAALRSWQLGSTLTPSQHRVRRPGAAKWFAYTVLKHRATFLSCVPLTRLGKDARAHHPPPHRGTYTAELTHKLSS